jgi:hypothetical protein
MGLNPESGGIAAEPEREACPPGISRRFRLDRELSIASLITLPRVSPSNLNSKIKG